MTEMSAPGLQWTYCHGICGQDHVCNLVLLHQAIVHSRQQRCTVLPGQVPAQAPSEMAESQMLVHTRLQRPHVDCAAHQAHIA